ncbi:MAG: hypothetical protein NT105_21615 [Verrucomicrobia bacterium]|nr:hypothetical protein [Verrucomicrobiota bacterium]
MSDVSRLSSKINPAILPGQENKHQPAGKVVRAGLRQDAGW